MTSRAPLRLTAVSDDPRFLRAVRPALGPDDRAEALTFDRVGTRPDAPLPEAVADAVGLADAVLVEWDPLRAAEVGAVCFRLRAPDTPLIAVGHPEPGADVAALAVGADRFHPLPLSVSLLRAQVVAHRRHGMTTEDRRQSDRPAWARERRVTVGPLHLDWAERAARVDGADLPLSPRQFEVLALFAARPREVLSRERVLHDVWGFAFDTGTNVVDVYVHHLRRSLTEAGLRTPIETVRGRGYRLVVDGER